jgi:hypothetical protein
MLALVAAFSVTGILVGLATTRQSRRRKLDEVRLRRLRESARDGSITLDLAEDGAVIARRSGRRDLERTFKKEVEKLKRKKK